MLHIKTVHLFTGSDHKIIWQAWTLNITLIFICILLYCYVSTKSKSSGTTHTSLTDLRFLRPDTFQT